MSSCTASHVILQYSSFEIRVRTILFWWPKYSGEENIPLVKNKALAIGTQSPVATTCLFVSRFMSWLPTALFLSINSNWNKLTSAFPSCRELILFNTSPYSCISGHLAFSFAVEINYFSTR